ncbi:glycosyltransferase family 2 protein [Glacieibacterium megasporae]|uniref:glycosyltransferase family 2 protein n=1 Tax=Glacieibacterium megasporae TaxID=2835787 RepID=UPI001C1E86D9|nr:glycosyltransferase [Polymorphobacter megasporae]UAJ11195.1 glycosyltransferase [Polymorphobacter megasporae]
MPAVSVIIPHFEDLANLGLCLDALAAQTFRDFETIVADNASPAGTAAVEAVIAGRATLVIAHERGAGAARNAGVAAAGAGILAFTDADCVPAPGWLAAGVTALTQADLVGGAMRVSFADEAAPTAVEAFERVFAFDNRAYVEGKGFSVTANLFTRRDVFDTVGGFRAHVSEDADWCLRARDAGYRIAYAADAIVAHPARRTWEQLTRKWERLVRESAALHTARGGGSAGWQVRTLLLPVSAIAHLPKVLGSAKLPRIADRIAAAGVLFKLRLWRFTAARRLA